MVYSIDVHRLTRDTSQYECPNLNQKPVINASASLVVPGYKTQQTYAPHPCTISLHQIRAQDSCTGFNGLRNLEKNLCRLKIALSLRICYRDVVNRRNWCRYSAYGFSTPWNDALTHTQVLARITADYSALHKIT